MTDWITRAMELPCGWVFVYEAPDGNDAEPSLAALLDEVRREHQDHEPGACKRDRS